MAIDPELREMLQRIIALLELSLLDVSECGHPEFIDLSVMGEPANSHIFCKVCKREIYQSAANKISN